MEEKTGAIRKRNVAYKLRIGDVLKGVPMMDEGKFLFLELGDKKVVRVNIMANCVDKYEFLNSLNSSCRTKASVKFIKTMYLEWLLPYTNSTYVLGRDHYIETILEALSPDGYEDNVKDIDTLLHTFSLDFSFIKVGIKEYVIILNELKEAESPHDRLTDALNSMESLLTALTEDLSDDQIINEPLYTTYLALKAEHS